MNNVGPNRIRHHGWSKRRGLPTITGAMLDVLIRLRTAQDLGEPYMDLDDIDKRTIKALGFRAWIDERGNKYKDYRISDAGLYALKVYEPQLKRKDGLCPECGQRPRHVTANGRKEGYCKPCLNAQSKRKRTLGIQNLNPEAFCPRCVAKGIKNPRKRHVRASGTVIPYCTHCERVRKRQAKRKAIKLRLQRVLAGEFVKCRLADCKEPVSHTQRSASDLCVKHLREYMNSYNARRRPEGHYANSFTSISVNEVFQRYPFIGTVEHFPWVIKEDGLRYFNWRQVSGWAWKEVPRDIIKCEDCNRKSVVEMVCPEGYAIYKCRKCQRRFRVVMEYDYFVQEDV